MLPSQTQLRGGILKERYFLELSLIFLASLLQLIGGIINYLSAQVVILEIYCVDAICITSD